MFLFCIFQTECGLNVSFFISCFNLYFSISAVAGIYLASKFAKLELEKQNWLGERSNGETIKEPKNSKRYKIQPGDTWKEVKATKTKHWWQNLPGGYEVHRDDLLDCCTQMLQVFEKKKR
tara:strand:+ start:228 stop:587 length:360 start_codon:yes stop_codon:yes gene_type:complete